jgi:hypothetical protein
MRKARTNENEFCVWHFFRFELNFYRPGSHDYSLCEALIATRFHAGWVGRRRFDAWHSCVTTARDRIISFGDAA